MRSGLPRPSLRSRAILGWIVGWAWILGLVAPASFETQAAAPTGHEICTAAGLATAGDPAERPVAPQEPDAHRHAHCVLCALHVDPLAPPGAAPGFGRRGLARRAGSAERRVVALRSRPVRTAAQPRAPPTSIG